MRGLKFVALALVFAISTVAMPSNFGGVTEAVAAKCGGDGQNPCYLAKAKKIRNARCTGRSFKDPVDGGTCWSCPAGYSRSATHVKSSKACVKPGYERLKGARFTGRSGSSACKRGEFYDPRNGGECWSCNGYKRTAAAVTAWDACIRDGYERFKRARHVRGPSWKACESGTFSHGVRGCFSCDGWRRTGHSIDGGKACVQNVSAHRRKAQYKRRAHCLRGESNHNGTCWKCEGTGYVRTGYYASDSKRACVRRFPPRFSKATRTGSYGSKSCSQKNREVYDPRNGGECWQCPKGFDRSWHPVTHNNSCIKRIAGRINDAINKRTAACKSGLIIAGDGLCRKKGQCGTLNKRPCTGADRNLIAYGSCNKGLKEHFRSNKCIKTKPGEIPFFASLGDVISETMKGGIKQCTTDLGNRLGRDKALSVAISGFPKWGNVPAKCAGYMGIGFLCQGPTIPLAIGDSLKALGNIPRSGRVFEDIAKAIAQQARDAYGKNPCARISTNPDPTARYMCAAGMFLIGDEFKASSCMVKSAAAGAFNELKLGGKFGRAQCTAMGKMMFQVSWNAFKARMMAKKLKGKWNKHKEKKRAKKAEREKNATNTADLGFRSGKEPPIFEDAIKKKNWAATLYGVYGKLTLPGTAAKIYNVMAKIPECNAGGQLALKKPRPTKLGKPKPVSAQGDVIFGVKPNGDFMFYERDRRSANLKGWRQQGLRIGSGWTGDFGTKVFAGSDGQVYGITPKGELRYYRFDLANGKWAVGQKKIGTGWHSFLHVFASNDGLIYAIRKNGELLAYRHDRNQKWIMSGRKIGTGWHNFHQVFAGGNGVIYAITRKGKLLYYRHNRDFAWMVASRAIGASWQKFSPVMSTGGGRIYAAGKDGKLYYYRHNAALKWVVDWKPVGDGGWNTGFRSLILGTVGNDAPLPTRLNPNHAWNRIAGKAIDIGAGPEGNVWVVGTDKAAYEWHKGKWVKRSGNLKLKRIDVAGRHEVWAIAENNDIWRVRHSKWTKTKGKALDIGVGAGGHVFAVSTDRVPYEWDGKRWNRRPGSGQDKIDVDPQGNIWIVNQGKDIWRWDGRRWHQVRGLKARDIGIGPGGRVFAVGVDGKGYLWGGGNKWLKNRPSGGQASVTASARGPIIVNTSGQIWAAK